ncbi:hypothetical protein JTE90_001211 [Oedothorax gibbosus]|uniref:Uncharacterized protein n=1 Tax=Oedothorax gibbosus TaxID=931172 RepID=A0AAV6UTU3_9ARAC|nr:hypothetical protein JTE90_001211 [Oedothorax gibbosus]
MDEKGGRDIDLSEYSVHVVVFCSIVRRRRKGKTGQISEEKFLKVKTSPDGQAPREKRFGHCQGRIGHGES